MSAPLTEAGNKRSSSPALAYPWVLFEHTEDSESIPAVSGLSWWKSMTSYGARLLSGVGARLLRLKQLSRQQHGNDNGGDDTDDDDDGDDDDNAAVSSLPAPNNELRPAPAEEGAKESGGPSDDASQRRVELNLFLERQCAVNPLHILPYNKSFGSSVIAGGASPFVLAPKALRIQILTWNVAQQCPADDPKPLRRWALGDELANRLEEGGDDGDVVPLDDFPDVVVVGLQEVEFGGVALVVETTDSSVAWMEAVTDCLNDAVQWRVRYKKLRTIQLVGIVLIVIVKAHHEPFVNHIRTSLSRTGAVGGVLGNKGSIGFRMTLYGKRFLFVCAHFHPHLKNEKTRIKNYHNALAELKFKLPRDADDAFDVIQLYDEAYRRMAEASCKKRRGLGLGIADHNDDDGGFDESNGNHSMIGGGGGVVYRQSDRTEGQSTWSRFFSRRSNRNEAVYKELHVLESHDYVFFFGDLNYRLHGISSSDIRQIVNDPTSSSASSFGQLLDEHDELSMLMRHRSVIFKGFDELRIDFPPTYKYDIGTDRFDTSKKRRDPAWTDRILYRVSSSCSSSHRSGSCDLQPPPGMGAAAESTEGTPLSKPPVGHREQDTSPLPNGAAPESTEDPCLSEFPRLASETFPDSSDDTDDSPLPSVAAPPTAAAHTNSSSRLSRSKSDMRSSTTSTSSARPDDNMMVRTAFSDIVANRLEVQQYQSVPSLRLSDHKPVYATFVVDAIGAPVHEIQSLMLQSRDYWDTGHCDVDGHL